jgi:ATP:corrinoid adenosyltransferase
MVPDGLGVGHVDRTELEIFERIRDETPANWIGLHHVGLPSHPSKPIAEIDFIVVAEPGIFCLEVKGGAASRRDGIWFAGSRELKESPFAQVGSAAAALRGVTPDLHRYVFGWGCVFPHCRFDVEGPEVLREVVYDEEAAGCGFHAYIEALGRYWGGRFSRSVPLRANDLSKATNALRGDFSVVESVMPVVRSARARLIAYTEGQARAIEGLRDQGQVVIRGGAGTGKTLLAVQEAIRLADSGKKTLFTCFTKAVAAHVEHSVQRPGLRVAHIDSLISFLIRAGETEDQIPTDIDDGERFDLYRPLAALEAIERLRDSVRYDAIVVDEGQDLLTQPRLDVLDALLRGGFREGSWRVFWDPLQALFGHRGDARLELIEQMSTCPVDYVLTINCRNTREIADRVEDLSGVNMDEVAFVDGPQPGDAEWDDERSHVKRVEATLRHWIERGVPPDSIVILSPRRFELSIASRLGKMAVRIVDCSGQRPEPEPGTISFSTIHAFKGLESEAVMLVDVDDLSSDRSRALLYVGASRARTLLGVARSSATAAVFAQRIAGRATRPQGGFKAWEEL